MFRLYHMTFSGTFRGTEEQAHHLHESPPSMLVPLMVLAAGSVLAGYLGIPAILGERVGFPNHFEHFLEPVFESAHETLPQVFSAQAPGHDIEWMLMGASVAVALLGIFLATLFFQRHPEIPKRLAGSLATLHRVLLRKYYVDEIYDLAFVRGAALGGGNALYSMDRYVVDGGDGEVRPGLGVNGVGWLTRDVVAKFSDAWDRYVVDGAVNLTAAVLDNASYVMRALQNGLVQHYALSALIGVFLMIAAGRFVLHLY
jgi:NADH-quinone oxidoreductase subunit L